MNILVTGGAGFIGSTLVDRLLAEDHTVEVLDDLSTGSLANLADARTTAVGRLKIHHLDCTDETVVDLVARRRPEVVFHLATPSPPGGAVGDPAPDVRRTLVGLVRLLEGARRAGTRKLVVATSATDLYGDTDKPVVETEPPRPATPAGVTRAAMIEYLRVHTERHGLDHTVLVLASVYGPRQSVDGEGAALVRFVAACRDGRPCVVEGDGEQTRDLLFVDDAVDALVRAVDRAPGMTVNVGSGLSVSVNELVQLAGALVGTVPEVEHRRARPGSARHGAVDIARAAIHLGWRPFTDLPEGLRRL